jgi:hypothetical protein
LLNIPKSAQSRTYFAPNNLAVFRTEKSRYFRVHAEDLLVLFPGAKMNWWSSNIGAGEDQLSFFPSNLTNPPWLLCEGCCVCSAWLWWPSSSRPLLVRTLAGLGNLV